MKAEPEVITEASHDHSSGGCSGWRLGENLPIFDSSQQRND
jgi:hypothetical protein